MCAGIEERECCSGVIGGRVDYLYPLSLDLISPKSRIGSRRHPKIASPSDTLIIYQLAVVVPQRSVEIASLEISFRQPFRLF